MSLDSPLEQTGFEPLVPRDTAEVSNGSHIGCSIPRQREGQREREPTPRRRRGVQPDRWLESVFLERQVGSELDVAEQKRPPPYPPRTWDLGAEPARICASWELPSAGLSRVT